MRKIFRYECRRLLLNKFFAGLVLVLLAYGAMVLESATILGVSHTAPLLPLELWGLSQPDAAPFVGRGIVLSDLLHLGRARRAMALTDAAPMDARRYALARCAAALAGTALMALCCLLEAAAFYGRYFGWYAWGSLLLPALTTLVPRWCSPWAAAGCWRASAPGCSIRGCSCPLRRRLCPCPRRWGCGTAVSSPPSRSPWGR